MSEAPAWLIARLPTNYGRHCLARRTPGLQELIETVVSMTWRLLPPMVGSVPPPAVVVVASEQSFTVTRTPEDGPSVIIFDEGMQRFFASITHHVVARSESLHVRVLLEKCFASRLYVSDRWVAAAAVGMLANEGITQHRGGRSLDPAESDIWSQLVRAQTVFTVAHETWHAVMRSSSAAAMLHQVLAWEATAYVAGHPLMDDRIAAEIERIMGTVSLLTGRAPEQRALRGGRLERILDSPAEHLLREEMICDLYGGLATIRMLTNLGIPQRVAIAGSVLALLNLTVFSYLSYIAEGTTAAAKEKMSNAFVRVEVLIAMLLSRVYEGEMERNADPRAAVAAVIENIAVVIDMYAPVADALTRLRWDTFADELLREPQLRKAARDLSEDRAHLSGIVGFAYPGYR